MGPMSDDPESTDPIGNEAEEAGPFVTKSTPAPAIGLTGEAAISLRLDAIVSEQKDQADRLTHMNELLEKVLAEVFKYHEEVKQELRELRRKLRELERRIEELEDQDEEDASP